MIYIFKVFVFQIRFRKKGKIDHSSKINSNLKRLWKKDFEHYLLNLNATPLCWWVIVFYQIEHVLIIVIFVNTAGFEQFSVLSSVFCCDTLDIEQSCSKYVQLMEMANCK